jgi:hypothetical protein
VRIDEILWDDQNEDHIARHSVTPEEAEEVVFDASSAFFRTGGGERPLRYLVLGLTEAGRYLLVVLEPPTRGQTYVVTARDMTDGEKRRFKRR